MNLARCMVRLSLSPVELLLQRVASVKKRLADNCDDRRIGGCSASSPIEPKTVPLSS